MIPAPEYTFYHDLARWWPLISPPEEYTEEAGFAAQLLASASIPVREVLELGCGGGHNASHLKHRFRMTLVDLSEDMLDVSRLLNPECLHHRGDMRTIRLDRQFDAVFIHDAIDYMTTEADLTLAVETAFVHCRPGGIALLAPDHTTETFEEGTDHGGCDAPDGRGVRYLEWTTDPDPEDTWIRTDYVFLLREADGSNRVVQETHRTGLFPRATWLGILEEAGFRPEAIPDQKAPPRELFLGRRPIS